MFKLLIADKSQERAEKIARDLNKCGFSAATIKENKISLRKYIKRHEPDALLIINSFSEKKTLSLISQSKKDGVPVIFILEESSTCPRLIKVLADTIIEVKDFDNLCRAYAGILEEKLNLLNHGTHGDRGIYYGMFYIDTDKNIVYYGKKKLELTPTEFQIMLILIMNKGKLVEKKEILKQIWGTCNLKTNTLSVHLQRIKKSLSKVTRKYRIVTVRGKGYKLEKVSS